MKYLLFSALFAVSCATAKPVGHVETSDVCALFPTLRIQICDAPGASTVRDWGLPTMTKFVTPSVTLSGSSLVLHDSQDESAKIYVEVSDGSAAAFNAQFIAQALKLTERFGYRAVSAKPDFCGHSDFVNNPGAMCANVRGRFIGRNRYVMLIGRWPAEQDEVMRHDFEVILNGIRPHAQE